MAPPGAHAKVRPRQLPPVELPEPLVPTLEPAVAPVAGPWERGAVERSFGPSRWYAIAKRVFDVVASLGLLVALAPVLLVIAAWVKLDSGGPALYGARRVGRGGRTIRVLKFRTMHPDAEERLVRLLDSDAARAAEFQETFKLKQDPRLTAAGRFLRRSSLDELPQLLNVLRGEMALVGPRPVVEAELALYRAVPGGAEAYLATRPGITGLWQVSGRNDLTYPQRIALDVGYSERCSLLLDLEILAKTPGAVLRGTGAY